MKNCTVPVNRGSGNYPVIHKSNGKMNSVAELAKNPELAHPTFTEVNYEIETYRGYIPVSQEAIDDADYDIPGLIAEDIRDQDLNTKNEQIAAIFKTATAKAVTGLDGIVKLLNTGFKQVYTVKFYLSASLFNEIDTLKDANGRYLLQDDITVASGKRIKGREVVVLDDDIIGEEEGNLVGFVGDAKEFCTLFNRKQASVKWVDNDIYGQLLAGYVRFDVKKVDAAAGYYITYSNATTPTV
ncbi:phage major capsid protein [Niallia sp. FSL R7-0271]|uniref:phage major capsid protein n=1 Tax=Niallia sp. FSL R7-0271 TaxID=2921678 RepID=UPI0030F6CD3C